MTGPSTRASPVSFSGSFTDPGSADTHTFVWHVVAGNGQATTDGTGQSFSFTPTDNGSYAVTFTVTDKDGGATSDNFTVTVDNVAPDRQPRQRRSDRRGQLRLGQLQRRIPTPSVDTAAGLHYASAAPTATCPAPPMRVAA